jgi:hypothetical protein
MRKSNLFAVSGVLALVFCCSARGQDRVREVDLCDLAAHPMDFNGQTVRLHGDLESTTETYVIAKTDCAAIPLEHPATVTPRPSFSLQKNAALRKLEKMQRVNSKQMQCLGPCPKGSYYDPITATVIGRVDAVPESYVQGPPLQRRGFGDKRASVVRIVVRSYTEVDGHIRPNSPTPAPQQGAITSAPASSLLHESGHVDPPKPQ